VGATGGWPMVPSAMSTFPSTAWTEVSRARSGGEPAAREALGFLCAAYWRPLYSFARRLGYTTEDAHDLTQGYFALLIEKDYLGDVRLREGRFRGFLLTSFKHFLSKELGLRGRRREAAAECRCRSTSGRPRDDRRRHQEDGAPAASPLRSSAPGRDRGHGGRTGRHRLRTSSSAVGSQAVGASGGVTFLLASVFQISEE
jgi:hypothetical protein